MSNLTDVLLKFWKSSPKNVIAQNTIATSIYKEILLRNVYASIEIINFPNEWDLDYFFTTLFSDGVICITDTTAGVIPLQTGTSGINYMNHPTTCIIANPVLGSFERTIEEDCALVKLQWNYHGINSLVSMYAQMLANCDASINVNLINSRVAFIGEAASEAQAKSMKKFYDTITSGEPAVFTKEGSNSNFWYLKPRESYIAGDILNLKTNIRNEFLRLFGINAVNSGKKERMISSEVEADNAEAPYNIAHFIDSINQGLTTANKLYNFNMFAKKRELNTKVGDMIDT